MSDQKRLCVYIHSANGQIFNVGQGNPTRPYNRCRRSPRWRGGFSALIKHGNPSSKSKVIHSPSDRAIELLCTGYTCRCNAMEKTMDYRRMEGSYRDNQKAAWSETCLIVCFILVQEFGLSKAEPLAHSMT